MSKNKNRIPLILRLIRWYFPKLEVISRSIAVQYFEKVFFTPLKYKSPEKEVEASNLSRQGEVLWNGKRIQTYEWGDATKPYVLVVHGWAGRATQFRKFIQPFNDAGLRIVGFDGPAHGKSDGKRTSLAEFDEVMQEIVIQKGVPIAIIAHSFGGGASLFSIRNGLPVSKLINIASPTIADEIIRTFLEAINGSWETGLRFKQLVEKKFGKPFEAFTATEIIKEIKELQLLLIHDTDDRDVKLLQAERMKAVYPAAELMVTTGLGHNRILKDDAVIAACLKFVKQDFKM